MNQATTTGLSYMSTDPINRQVGGGHYLDYEIQPIEFIQKNRVPFCEGNVIKYVMRHAYKNGRQDLEKAIHYLEMLIEMEYLGDRQKPVNISSEDVSTSEISSIIEVL
jgi:hypothetical protein